MKRTTLIFSTFLVAFCLNGCELAEPAMEEIELITNTWVVSNVYIDGQKDIVTSYDDFVLTLHPGEHYEMTDIYGVTTEGPWQIIHDNTELVLHAGTNLEKRYRIIEISDSELVLLFEDLYFKDIKSVFRYELIPG